MSSELPAGWARATLGQVVNRPRPKASPSEHADLPFVGMDSIAPGGMDLLGVGRFGDMKSAGGIFEPGDVLYGRMRPYLNKVHHARQSGACSAEFIVMPPSVLIDSDFLAYLLHRRAFVNFASSQSSGDRPRVDFDGLASFEFGLPPKNEQRRIVSRIEELFSEIDAGERALERAQKLVERYRQSVLEAAITGQLTQEWREAHAAVKGDTHSIPDLPTGWVNVTLGSLCTKVTSGSRDWKHFYGRGDGVFIMAQNVRPGRLDFSAVQRVDPPVGSKDAERSQVAESDLLVTIVGANTGDVCRVDRPLSKHYVCQSVALVRLADARLAPYVELYLVAEDGGQAQFAETIYGAGRPHLSFDQLKSVVIPLPPIEEQVAIVDAVMRDESELQATAQALAAARRQSSALRQAVLEAAFSGQLVPQELNDEPAAALLARLGRQPVVTPATARRRRARTEPAHP